MSLTTVQPGMLGTPQPYNFKNRLINGQMQINQRASSYAPNASGVYTLDRWLSYASTGTVAITQSTDAPVGFSNSFLWTTTSGGTRNAGDYYEFVQLIEGYNFADLNWGTANAKTVTVSFWVKSSVTGVFGVLFRNAGVGGYVNYVTSYTINSANTWEYKTITVPGPTSGTWGTTNNTGLQLWFDLGSGSSYQTASVNTWLTGAGSALTPTTQAALGSVTGSTYQITGVQFEVGVSATTFDYRPYTTELQLCQRYLPVIPFAPLGQYLLYSGMAYSSIYSFFAIPLLVSARVAPTGISYSGTVSNLAIYNAATTIAPVAMILDSASTSRITLRTQVASGQTTGYCVFLASENSSVTQILCTGCEL
jgi:hypothetical protein